LQKYLTQIYTMTSYQNALDYAKDQIQQGKISHLQANVLIVQMMGVRVIEGKIPREVRKTLNEAVKNGELGHLKKDGLKPEIYHHKNARTNALDERQRIALASAEIIKSCFA